MPQYKPGESGSIEHQFKPGQSGNPAGRKPGTKTISEKLKKILEIELTVTDPVTKQICQKQVSEIIGLQLASQAMTGNIKAIKLILERMEGKIADYENPGREDWIGEQLQIIINEEEAKQNADEFLEKQ